MFPAGARVIQGDPSRPETLAAALSGIEAILLSPRAVGAAASRLLTLAAQRGVRRAVVLSALTVEYGGGYRGGGRGIWGVLGGRAEARPRRSLLLSPR